MVTRNKRYRLRSYRPDQGATDDDDDRVTITSQQEAGEQVDIESHSDMEELVNETPELYQNLKNRLKWEVVQQNAASKKTIPVYNSQVPFVSKIKTPIEYFREFMGVEYMT